MASAPRLIAAATLVLVELASAPINTQAAAAGSVDVMDQPYGAKGDGETDDTAAINAAMDVFRKRLGNGPARLVFPPGHIFRVASLGGVNATRLISSAYDGVVEMTGARLLCQTHGTPCIDAAGSAHLSWRDLSLVGSAENPSSIGIQLARETAFTTASASHYTACGEQHFDNAHITGSWTVAGRYEFACETVRWSSPHIENDYTGPGEAYAVIADGCNHWHVRSAYITIEASPDKCISFDEHVDDTAAFVRNSGDNREGGVIWIGGAIRHRFASSSYALALGPAHEVVLWDNGTGSNTGLDFDISRARRRAMCFFSRAQTPHPGCRVSAISISNRRRPSPSSLSIVALRRHR